MAGKEGKKGRKFGRNARRPSTARRRDRRPDLFKKARNIVRSGGSEEFLRAWADRRVRRGDPAGRVFKARDAALTRIAVKEAF